MEGKFHHPQKVCPTGKDPGDLPFAPKANATRLDLVPAFAQQTHVLEFTKVFEECDELSPWALKDPSLSLADPHPVWLSSPPSSCDLGMFALAGMKAAS